MPKLRWRPPTLMIAIAEAALLLGGLASSDGFIATLALWAAIVAWPLWLYRHPAFLLVWAYVAVVGYLLLAPLLAQVWMMAQHTLFGRTVC